MTDTLLHIWPWWVRVTHWALVSVFVLNYFMLEPGGSLHNWLGYAVTALVVARIGLGFSRHSQYASFRYLNLSRQAVTHHLGELRQRRVPAASGHNPLGWLMVFLFWFLLLTLAVSGFLAEEADYFFGNRTLDTLHIWAADAMLTAAAVHVASVLLVGFWGRIELIRPMLTGVRRTR